MGDLISYKKWTITQKLQELRKKLSRLVPESKEWMDIKLRIIQLRKDFKDE